MSRIQNDTSTLSRIQEANATNPNGTRGGDLAELDMNSFLQLMIAELQNQDPLNPMDNADLLNQMGQMREIAANDSLTKTLESVLHRQNLATASSLIGKTVKALDDENAEVVGAVDRVTMAVDENDAPTIRIQIGGSSIKLSNIREIVDADDSGGVAAFLPSDGQSAPASTGGSAPQ